MIKIRELKKKLIKQSVISLCILLVAGGLLYFVMQAYQEVESEKTSLERSLRQKNAQIAQLEQKFNIYESSFSAFQDIEAQLQSNAYTLDNDKARQHIQYLYKEHRITNLNLAISPQERFEEANANYVGYEPVFRNVELTFSALSDAHIYVFLNQLEEMLSGIVKYTNSGFAKACCS